MFKDIDIFIAAAQAIWQGQNPYTLPGIEAFYPLPFYLFFLPFAWLPLPVVHVVWTALNALVFVAILRKRAVIVALSMQALLTLLLGQVDIVIMALYALLRSGIGGGIALAIIVFKPHVVLLLTPWLLWQWWRNDRRQLAVFIGIAGTLTLASFIAQPDWVTSLLARSGERTRWQISSSVWGLVSWLPSPNWFILGGIIALSAIIWAWRANRVDAVQTVGLLISPLIFSYNLMPLYVMFKSNTLLLTMTAISWAAFVVSAFDVNDRASVALPLFGLAVLFVEWRRGVLLPNRERSSATA